MCMYMSVYEKDKLSAAKEHRLTLLYFRNECYAAAHIIEGSSMIIGH